jgi:hypothetical protein
MVFVQATLLGLLSVAEGIGDSSCTAPQQESVLLQARGLLNAKLDLNASLSLAQLDTPQCRFATAYTADELISDTDAQDAYTASVLKWDGKFASPGAALTPTGLTIDHINLDENGAITDKGYYTAPSKESLHLSMLALVLAQTPLAYNWLADNQEDAEVEAIRRLKLIIEQYEEFSNEQCPACGGFIPWVGVGETGGFQRVKKFKMPSLDNGQMAWGMVSVLQALEEAKQRPERDEADLTDLKSRYQAHVDLMKGAVSTIFQNPKGKVSTMAKAKDPKAPIDPTDYKQKGSLQDPFEGELMLMFIDMMTEGDGRPTDKSIAKMWKKYNKGNNVGTWTSDETGPITIQKGWRFSAHEAWKYLVLPYLDEEFDTVRRLFRNQERVRTWEAHNSGIPGLKAACYGTNPWYVDRLGVLAASNGFDDQVRESDKMVTPYGAFPLILIDRGQGLAWHRAMLARPRMQNQYGSTEAGRQNSENPGVAMKCTWDTKVTTDVALLGGTQALLKRYLQANGQWDRFVERVTLNHQKYESLEGEDVPFAPPPAQEVTDGAEDFSTCPA